MAASLTQHNESSAVQRSHHSFAGNAGQFAHRLSIDDARGRVSMGMELQKLYLGGKGGNDGKPITQRF
jgi:hypothetical protein